jgi:hypothetical protein
MDGEMHRRRAVYTASFIDVEIQSVNTIPASREQHINPGQIRDIPIEV